MMVISSFMLRVRFNRSFNTNEYAKLMKELSKYVVFSVAMKGDEYCLYESFMILLSEREVGFAEVGLFQDFVGNRYFRVHITIAMVIDPLLGDTRKKLAIFPILLRFFKTQYENILLRPM